MDLRQLRYLVAVAEERSISRAAARLNMSQPPLSTAIARMERELGVTLLDRQARGVEPTEAGAYLVENARRLLAIVDEVATSVVAVGTGRRGRLSLAVVSGSLWDLVPSALRVVVHNRPDIEIACAETSPADVVERVRSQRADAGLVYTSSTRYLERLAGLDLEVAMVRREPLVAVLPTTAAGLPPVVDLTRLAGERWLVPQPGADWPELSDVLTEAWHRAGVALPPTHTVSGLDEALQLAAAGLGVTLLPASVSGAARRDVVIRQVSQHLPPIEWAVLWRRHERPSPVLARFLRASLSTPEPDRLGPDLARETSTGGPTEPR